MNLSHQKSKFLFATRPIFIAVFAAIFLNGLFAAPANAAPDEWHIKDDATGGECTLIGTWDAGSKTCTLTQDLTQSSIFIDSDYLTLDGGGHTTTGSSAIAVGVYLLSRTGVTIRNLNVTSFSYGIFLNSSSNNTLTGNTSNNNSLGIYLVYSSNNTLAGNTVSNTDFYGLSWGISLYLSHNNTLTGNTSNNRSLGIYLEYSSNNTLTGNTSNNNHHGIFLGASSNNTLTGNTASANTFTGIFFHAAVLNTFVNNTIRNNHYGIYFSSPSKNQTFYNNNFQNNTVQVQLSESAGWGNIFNLAAPMGGNYWSNFDEPAEGCNNLNNDGFCDAPYIFDGGQDNLPWTKKDGWDALQNQPPTLSYSQDPGYASDTESPGVDSNKGTTETEFTFKTVYTDADNNAPENVSLVVGDGIATTTRGLTLDAAAPAELRDGNYANGEQLTATSTFSQKAGYLYHFEGSDGKGGAARIPATGELNFTIINVPVIVVPGIMGSYLYYNDSKVWLPEVNGIDEFQKLQLGSNGESIYPIAAIGAIEEFRSFVKVLPCIGSPVPCSDLVTNTFSLLFRYLEEAGYKKYILGKDGKIDFYNGEDLFVFAYDWRLDIRNSAKNLAAAIDEITSKTGSEKVNIVAHSQGGLVTKQYVEERGGGLVDKVIFVGTPHLGAPKAFKVLLHGGDLMETSYLKIMSGDLQASFGGLAKNMPSAYQLLPSRQYVNEESENYVHDKIFGSGWLDYNNTLKFVEDHVADSQEDFFGRAILLHGDGSNVDGGINGIDTLDLPSKGIHTYNISGCSGGTIGAIRYYWHYTYLAPFPDIAHDILWVNGDMTVPLLSAQSTRANSYYYVKDGIHSDLPSTWGAYQLIGSILQNKSSTFDFTMFSHVGESSNVCDIGTGTGAVIGELFGYAISVHSPIDLHIYDSQGRHLGPVSNERFIETNIPLASYETIGHEKFIFLPIGNTYRIVGEGTSAGTFDMEVKIIEDGNVIKTVLYDDVHVSGTEMRIRGEISSVKMNHLLEVDQNGDGIFESMTEPSAVLNAEESGDVTAPTTTGSIIGPKLNTGMWYVGTTTVSLTATDDNSGVLKMDYSLDGGRTWNIYVNPFPVSEEGTTTVSYFSIDRAGNNEMLKTLQIKIDKTPPEAKIFFDPIIKQLKVEGVDNLSSVEVVQNGTMYTLTDEADHTLVVAYDKLKIEGKEIQAGIRVLRYDGVLAPTIPKNILQYEWSLKEDGSIKELNQRVEIEKSFDIHAHYNAKKNETIIDTKMGDKKDEKKTKQNFSGLVSLNLTTHSGNFDIKYGD